MAAGCWLHLAMTSRIQVETVDDDEEHVDFSSLQKDLDRLDELANDESLQELMDRAKKAVRSETLLSPAFREKTPDNNAKSSLTPAELPPRPIQTPPSHLLSSNPPLYAKTSMNSPLIATANEDYPVRSTKAAASPPLPSSYSESNHEAFATFQRVLALMADTLERQDSRIRALELENEDLRQENKNLLRVLASTASTHQDVSSPPPSAARRSFSPGTKFVGDLSRCMDVPDDVAVPLSYIMDKHFDRLNDIRSRLDK
jgi:hypothetical protein